MPSKYAAILTKLPRLIGAEPEFQEKVNAIKAEIVKEPTADIGEFSLDKHLQEIHTHMAYVKDGLLRSTKGRRYASDFARAYGDLRRVKATLDAHQSDVNVLIEAYSQLIIDQYEVEGTTSIRLATGEGVFVQPEPFAIIQDRDKFRRWCVSNGLERSLVLPWQTANNITKQMLMDGLREPDGVTCYLRNKIVLRKGS